MLSYAVQEVSEDVVVPIPQAARVPFLKNNHLAVPDKIWPGHSGVYQWESSENALKTKKPPVRSKHWGLWALHVHTLRLSHLSISVGMGMFSCAGHCCVILSTAQQIVWRIQACLARHLSDTSVLITKQQWELWMPFFKIPSLWQKRNAQI